jgi:hypothetical protein
MKDFFRILLVAWLFWVIVSLYNFGFLGGLVFPFSWPFLGNSYLQFLPFAVLLLACAMGVMVVVIWLAAGRIRKLSGKVLLANSVFLLTFVGVAELRR